MKIEVPCLRVDWMVDNIPIGTVFTGSFRGTCGTWLRVLSPRNRLVKLETSELFQEFNKDEYIGDYRPFKTVRLVLED